MFNRSSCAHSHSTCSGSSIAGLILFTELALSHRTRTQSLPDISRRTTGEETSRRLTLKRRRETSSQTSCLPDRCPSKRGECMKVLNIQNNIFEEFVNYDVVIVWKEGSRMLYFSVFSCIGKSILVDIKKMISFFLCIKQNIASFDFSVCVCVPLWLFGESGLLLHCVFWIHVSSFILFRMITGRKIKFEMETSDAPSPYTTFLTM